MKRRPTHVTEWRDVEHMVVEHDQPFPYQVDGDYLGDVEPARVRLRARRRHGSCSPAPHPERARGRRLRRADRERDVGDVGADAVDAPGDQLAHPVGVVAGPGVDGEPGAVRGADRRLGRACRPTGGPPRDRPRPCAPITSSSSVLDQPRRAHRRQHGAAHADGLERNDEINHRTPAASPREQVGDAMRHPVGRVEVGLVGIVLDLDVDEDPGAGVERVGQRRDVIGQVGRDACRRSTRPSASRGSWCTTSRSSAVRRTSSSTPSAPIATARPNAASVFSRSAREAPRWPMIVVMAARVVSRPTPPRRRPNG